MPPVSVRTLHLLAPAITTDLFKERLKPLIGSGKPITALTTYTMTDELEQDDDSLKPYGKSLLYLVSDAFEDEKPDADPRTAEEPEAGPAADPVLRAGRHGEGRRHRVLEDAAGRPLTARTESITHGGFDNDVATMTSVIRRVLDVPDTTAVVDYFEETIPGFDRAAVGAVRSGARHAHARAACGHAHPRARRRCAPTPREEVDGDGLDGRRQRSRVVRRQGPRRDEAGRLDRRGQRASCSSTA